MRIGIVNDTLMAVEAMRRVLVASRKHEVAWIARDGAEAVRLCAREKPDLILMDLIMPVMDGVKATRAIMASTPCLILIVTGSVDQNTSLAFEALGAGAMDVVNTPIFDPTALKAGSDPLLAKIETLGKFIGESRPSEASSTVKGPMASGGRNCPDSLIAIGASAGGPAAVAEILRRLPSDLSAAVVVIQHVDEQFAAGLAEWLTTQSVMPVRIAREGDEPRTGVVLLAGTSDHLVFTNPETLGYTPIPRDYAYRPSVDAFFQSVLLHWHGRVVGVVLTGMGRDGAVGLKALRDAGNITIAQDRASSAVYGMPKAAVDIGAASEILPLDRIANRLAGLSIPRLTRSL